MTTTTEQPAGGVTPPAGSTNSDANPSGKPPGESQVPAEGGNAAAAPEAYADFNLPEGMTADALNLSDLTDAFKAAGLSQEAAQKFVDAHAAKVKAGEEASAAAFNQQIKTWETELRADATLGGANYDKTVQTAAIALDKFATPELKAQFGDNLFKHPGMVRFLNSIGAALREHVPGNTGNGGTPPKAKSVAEIMYPNETAAKK